MSEPARRTWNCRRLAGGLLLAVLALVFAGVAPAAAQSLESALSPGPLVRSHAKAEADCSQCHVRFDRAGQDRLCVACHKDIGLDLQHRSGLHGRQKPQPCRACHTDHRGREMDIAPLNTRAFDHHRTDYPLEGRHVGVACRSCHAAGRKYSQAPTDCLGCHARDDRHRGTLGKACGDCHVVQGWKETRFDHGRTKFALTGRHADARCDACHRSAVYGEAPSTCVGCHRKDDRHKARYGEKCESCHTTRDWKGLVFRHDSDTGYPLRGRHREARCESCHTTGWVYRDKPATDCVSCHGKHDRHEGTLGPDCVACHVERGWKEPARFDHDTSRFPLRGAHAGPACKACHVDALYRRTPADCVACHGKDDRHEGTLGKACADCHTDRDWKASRFDHARTRFVLRHGHAVPPLRCESCHRDLKSFRAATPPPDCLSCHRKDDLHEGQLGGRCENCHGERQWTHTRFDHARARFTLTGAHVGVQCKSCHATPRYRDAARDCIGCHLREDRHAARFGQACASCHNTRDWRLWAFDHARRTNYPLEAGHAQVACEACHTKPAARGKAAAPLDRGCLACHRRDDIHDGAFGARCEQCHTVTRWKQVSHRRSAAVRPGPRLVTAWKGPPS